MQIVVIVKLGQLASVRLVLRVPNQLQPRERLTQSESADV